VDKLVVLLLLPMLLVGGCRGIDDVERATAMLAVPPGGRVDPPTERGASVCYVGRRAADTVARVRDTLRGAGWPEVVIEPHPAVPGRWSVRGLHDGLALAGVVEEHQPDCAGARLRLGVHAVTPGAHRKTAGAPRGRAPITP
jgi:hypothetical protein